MFYLYLGISAVASLVLHSISFSWFQTNQDNNYHNIINLWLKDPFEFVTLVNQDQSCPKNTETLNLSLDYPGNSGICNCIPNPQDSYSTSSNSLDSYHRILQKSLSLCSLTQCQSGYVQNQVIEPIASQEIKTFFYNSSTKRPMKVCASKIAGYSFAKKAPLQKQCNSDEKYCNFKTKNPEQFDIDQGYCIPKGRQCQSQSFQLGNYANSVTNQLPIVDINISIEGEISAYNIVKHSTIKEKDLLNWNYITYDPAYQSYLTKSYQIQINHMPRVKVRCREQLQQNLDVYLGPDGAYKVSLALLIFSTFSCVLNFIYFGIGDICDMASCNKSGCQGYCEAKRIQKNHSKFRNVLIVLKPTLLLLQVILNAVMIACYTNMIDYMGFMINDKCLDQYVAQAINYDLIISVGYYQEGLTFATLAISAVQLFFDQMFYLTIKTLILFLFCQIKCQSKQQKPVDIKLETQADQKLNQDQKKIDIENNCQIEQNALTQTKTVFPIITQQHPNNHDNLTDKTGNYDTKHFQGSKSSSNLCELKQTNVETIKSVGAIQTQIIQPNIKQAQEENLTKQQFKQKKKKLKKQLKEKTKEAKLLEQVQKGKILNQHNVFQEDNFGVQTLYEDQQQQTKNNIRQIKHSNSIDYVDHDLNKRLQEIQTKVEKLGNQSFQDTATKQQKNLLIISKDDSLNSSYEEQKNNNNHDKIQQKNQQKKQKEIIEDNLGDIFTDFNEKLQEQLQNFQQNQIQQPMGLNNQKTQINSGQVIYESKENQQFDIEDQKRSDKFIYTKKRSSEIIQPPEAPEPPEQSEKSHFSVIQFDDF